MASGTQRWVRSGMRDRQLEHLHAAHRAADRGEELADAEVVEQQHLRVHHVLDGDHREVGAVGLAGGGVLRGRPGAPAAAADDVGADDEVLVGVEPLAGTDHHVPPARALVARAVQPCHVGVPGERVGDEDGVVLALAQRAVGLVGQRERRQRAAPFEGELLPGLVERHVPGTDDSGVAGVVVVPHGDVADLLAGCGLLLGHGSGDSNERGRTAGERAAGRRCVRPPPRRARARAARPSGLGERLVDVGDDVLEGLDADAQADEIVGDAGCQLLLGRQLRVGRRRRVDDQ